MNLTIQPKLQTNQNLINFINEGKGLKAVSADYILTGKAAQRARHAKNIDELDLVVLKSSPKDVEYVNNKRHKKYERLKSVMPAIFVIAFGESLYGLSCIFNSLFKKKNVFKELKDWHNLPLMANLLLLGFIGIVAYDYVGKAAPRVEFNSHSARKNTGTEYASFEVMREIVKDITNPFR